MTDFEAFTWTFPLKEFKNISVEKKDAFDCAEIRGQVFSLPINCSNR